MEKEDVKTLTLVSYSGENILSIEYDDWDNLMYVYVNLTNYSFWKRLKIGVKYMLGYKSRCGDWDGVIMAPADVEKLKEMLSNIKNDLK